MASYKAEICLNKKANPSTNFPLFFVPKVGTKNTSSSFIPFFSLQKLEQKASRNNQRAVRLFTSQTKAR